MLAHEIGHHLLQHPDKKGRIYGKIPKMQRLAKERQWELAADKFSGRVLGRMGATLADSQAIFRLLKIHQNEQLSNHPQVARRLKAVKSGWLIGNQQAKTQCNGLTMPDADCKIIPPTGRRVTPRYVSLLKLAQDLRGKKVTKYYCQQYAYVALQQTQRAKQSRCGFTLAKHNKDSSPWSTFSAPQINWCMWHTSKATYKEAKFRETKLAECYKRR